MKFSYQAFWTRPDGIGEPYGPPHVMHHPSVDEAREYIGPIVRDAGVKVHAVKLTSEDGETSETWVGLERGWRNIDTRLLPPTH